MANINDAILQATGGPTINEGLADWFTKTADENLMDAEARWLLSQVSVLALAPVNDMWFTFLRASGYTGSLADMLMDYWIAQAQGVAVQAVAAVIPEVDDHAIIISHSGIISGLPLNTDYTVTGKTVVDVAHTPNNSAGIILTVDSAFGDQDVVTVSLIDTTASNIDDFTDLPVLNRVAPTTAPIFAGVFAPPAAVVGTPYVYNVAQFFQTGGRPTVYEEFFNLASSGLNLSAETGRISGTPVNDGTWSAQVRGRNAFGFDITNVADLIITDPP